jgi:hypothetical protein
MVSRTRLNVTFYVQYSTVQCSTIQYSTVQYSTVQYSTVQYSTVQYSTVQYSTVHYSAVQYSTVQYSTVQYSTVHIYTKPINRTTQSKQYTEKHKNFGIMRAVPLLGELYLGICLTTEEKARKNLSQGSRTIRIHRRNHKNT